jgi:stage V sporulation protein G
VRITSVRVNRSIEHREVPRDGSRLLAFASIVLDNIFVVSHIRVVLTPEGRRMVAMPSRATPTGNYKDVAYPLTDSLREQIRGKVLEAVDRS